MKGSNRRRYFTEAELGKLIGAARKGRYGRPHLPTFSSGCSIISIAGAAGGFTFRAAFFTGARLVLALAAALVFAALATLRALPRLAVLPFGSFPRF
jgi:hypothetical protein